MIEGPFTVYDLDYLPDDGRRYELIDGELSIDGEDVPGRQQIVYKLYTLLESIRPDHVSVLGGPVGIALSPNSAVQPDLLVAPFEENSLPSTPLLAVEILSPSSAITDFNKKRTYKRFGVPSYWVIDPDKPSLLAFQLDENGRYQTIAEVAGDKPFEAIQPFPVRIVLTELLGRFANL